MRKKFIFNFIISFISYIVIDVIEVFVFSLFAPSTGLLWEYIRTLFYNYFFGGVTFFCIELLLSIIFPLVMYIVIGSKLKQLGKYSLNYLSISSSFIFLMVIAAIFFKFKLKAEFSYFYLVFGHFTIFLFDIIRNDIFLYFILSIIPSIFLWLGMVYKSIKTKKAVNKDK